MNRAGRIDIAGLVLAGGSARRFAGESKGFALLGGEPLIAHALRPLKPLARIAINCNADKDLYSAYAETLIADYRAGEGPLAGIEAGLVWVASLTPRPRWLASVPLDTPFLPDDFIARLERSNADADVVIAVTEKDRSPVCALWSLEQLPTLSSALERGMRKMTDYLALVRQREAKLDENSVDPLFNVNTQADLSEAQALFARFRSP